MTSPWSSGPKEILKHGLSLLSEDTDSNRRLAMIIVDNAVELIIKTYLGLPKRVTGIHISRAKSTEIMESFPKLLDALEEYASEKLDGVNLGEIEWYHRLRNQLYHQGNGLTVERSNVEIYAELAKLLLFRFFGEELEIQVSDEARLVGEFIIGWSKLERGIINYSEFKNDTYGRSPNVLAAAKLLVESSEMSPDLYHRIKYLQDVRNKVVHGHGSEREKVGLPEDAILILCQVHEWLKLMDKQYAAEYA